MTSLKYYDVLNCHLIKFKDILVIMRSDNKIK